MKLTTAVALSLVCLVGLNGCSLLVAGVVGAAVTPFVQPQVDRMLSGMGLDSLDPGGVEAVRKHDDALNQ